MSAAARLHKLFAPLLVTVLLCTASTASADTAEWAFAERYAEEWQTTGCVPEVLPNGGGLRIHVKPGDKWVGITGSTWWTDMFDVRVEYELSPDVPDHTEVVLRLFNDEKKRHVDLAHKLRLYKDKATGEVHPSSYANLRSYHDAKLMGTRGSHQYGITRSLRFTKDGMQVFGFQGNIAGGWKGPLAYRYVPMHYDCKRYRIGVYLSVPPKAPEFDLVIKRIWVWSSLYRAPDRNEAEQNCCRAPDETEKDPRVWRFDFGPPGQQLAKQHIPISQWTMYDTRRGWGWRTDLEPIWSSAKIPQLPNDEAAKLGLEATPNPGWRGANDMTINYMIAHKKRYITSMSHGGDYVRFFERWMDLKIPLERDMVYAKRPYGFPRNRAIEADQWERRAAIYVDDDLLTEFVVDLPSDRYTLLAGVGYTGGGPLGASSPFSLEAEGIFAKKDLSENWRRCKMFRCDDVVVSDGQLNVKLRADRRVAMNRVDVWALGVSWQINYLLIVPTERREAIKAEQWRVISDRGRKIRQVSFVKGEPIDVRVRDNHLVLNGKPHFPALWQFYQGDHHAHYPYYLWGNNIAKVGVSWQFRGSQHFLQHDWVQLSAADNYPWRAIDHLNVAHRLGHSSLLMCEALLSFIPRAIMGEGGTLQDARGRTDRWNAQPPLNSRLHREIQREAYTMVSQQLKLHPDVMGHYVYEEYWHPRGKGYDYQSLQQFRKWLMKKYEDLAALNAEWGSNYKSYDEITPPAKPEESACWVNFRRFRMYAQQETVRHACDVLRELEPEHMRFLAKGDYATASWYYARDVELFGWYSPNHARAAAYHFGRVPVVGGGLFQCPYGWEDGRKQLDHKPAYGRHSLGVGSDDVYNQFMTKIFRGARGVYNEEYDDGIQHMFHRTRYIETASKAGLVRLWYGALAQFDPPAFEGPDVLIDEAPLKYTRFMAWAYRNAPLFLPTKMPKAPVAIVSTDESHYDLPDAGELFSTVHVENLMDAIGMPVDIVRSDNFDELMDYKAVVVGLFSAALKPEQAEKLKEFVRKGGKVLWIIPAGYRSGIDLKPGKEAPRFGLAELTACSFREVLVRGRRATTGESVTLVPNRLTPSVTGEVDVGTATVPGFAMSPGKGCTVFARAGETPCGVVNPDGSVVTLNMTLGPRRMPRVDTDREAYKAFHLKLHALLRDIFYGMWQIDPGREIEGAKRPDQLDLEVLIGDGYSMFALINHGSDAEQVTVKPGLPPGRYELVDVTGERPIVVKDADGANRLSPDEEKRHVEVLARDVSHEDLRRRGLELAAPGQTSRVVLARLVGTKVLVDCPDYALKSRCSRPVTVVVGDEAPAPEREAADRIRGFLTQRDVPAQVVKASEIKIGKTRHEVRVDPRDGKERRDQKDWFLVDVFENRPIDTDRHLIIVGGEVTNRLAKHIGAVGTFTYDKVLEKVTSGYPGPGRGVVQMVDSVNFPYYVANDATRDAILIGGSDAAGTVLAADTFLAMIKDLPKYVPPEEEQEMEVDDTPDPDHLRQNP